MPLIIAIEPDRKQAARITSLARERLNVELLVMESAERALHALSERVPDLILTSLLLSGKDEAALNERLRQLDAAGSHVQTLMIPVLASSGRRATRTNGLLNRLRRTKDEPVTEGGCDPAVFAAQIAEYLENAANERAAQATIAEDDRALAEEDRAYRIAETKKPEIEPPSLIAPPAYEVVESLSFSDRLADLTAPQAKREAFQFEPIAMPESQFEPIAMTESRFDPIAMPELRFEPIAMSEPGAEVAPLPESASSNAGDDFAMLSSEAENPVPAGIVDDEQMPEPVAEEQPETGLEPLVLSAGPALEQPEADTLEVVTRSFDEFVVPEELGVVDAPTIALGEFADDMAQFATEATWNTLESGMELDSVLDELEVLDEPEIPAGVEFQADSLDSESFQAEPSPTASDFDFEIDLWMPLPVAATRRWPTLEGPVVKASFIPSFDAPADPDVEFAPPPSPERLSARKRKSKPAQDEWGFFDPAQCGFAALLAKLDQVTDDE